MVALRLTLLGGFDARVAAGDTVNLSTKKAQALLAYLGLRPGHAHQRDKLAALLWGDRSDQRARDDFRHALLALRKALGGATPPPLLADGRTLALNPAVVDVDAATFERRVSEGTPRALEQAAELYQGDLLLGFTVSEPLFEEWLVAERERLRELALEALAKLLAHQQSAGRAEAAVQTALRLLALDPLQETVHRALMRLYSQLGRRGAALRHYQLCVGVLQRELRVEPEAETRQLYQEILRRRPQRDPGLGTVRRGVEHESVPAPSVIGAMLTPLIGREGEVTRLRQALADARAGAGRLVEILGEAGIGKTRLITEIASEASQLGVQLLMGRCYESDRILPFGPWVDALRRSGIAKDRALMDELAPPWHAELTRLLPEVDAPGLPAPRDNQLRLFEGVARLMERLAGRRPVLLVLEDVHWADEMSLRLLAFVTRRIDQWRVLVLATAREEELAEASAVRHTLTELGREPHATLLRLPPLSRPDTAALVRSLSEVASDAETLAHLEAQVWRVSEGCPFVAVETTRALQDGSIVADPATLPVAHRVRELIAGRLERLSARTRDVAAVAAVIGREFDFPLLQRAAQLGEAAAAKAMEELVRHRALHGMGERFDFTHERVQAVVYEQILPLRRKLLHRRVGEAIEELHGANLEPHVLALGMHYLRAEVWDKALRYLRQAGTQAVARSAHREAVTCFEQALAVLSRLPASQARQELATDLHLDLCVPLQISRGLEQATACSREAERLARQLDDSQRLAWASVHMCHHYRMIGQMEEASIVGQRAVMIADYLHDVPLMISAPYSLGLVRSYLGDYRGAEDLLRKAILATERNGVHDRCGLDGLPAVMARGHLARMLAECGRFEEGIPLGQRAIESGEALDHPASLVMACWGLGWLHNMRGGFNQAVPLLERGHALSRKWELSGWIPNVLEELGFAYACSGRRDHGVRILEESSDAYAAIGRHPLTVHLGEAYLLADRPDEAAVFAEKTLVLAQQLGQPRLQALALRLSSESASQCDPVARHAAEVRYPQAMALAEHLGMHPLVAHCHLGIGKLYRRMQRHEQAQEHLTTATTMYREMGMTYWLEKAEAEMRESV